MANSWRYGMVGVGLLYSVASYAGSSINTFGSFEGIAIGGFDTVAFFTEKKALKGTSELAHEWMGAKWLFTSQSNLDLFKANPEQYAPQYGGHCALGMSDGYLSRKPTNGQFEIVKGKLYLFPAGNDGNPSSARTAWWQSGGGPSGRIHWADRHWQRVKEALERK